MPPTRRNPIDSTTALKQACEAADPFIYLEVDIKITKGPHEDVARGCSILLGPLASLETDGVSMSFAGPFGIGGSRDRSMTFKNSVWQAESLGFGGSDQSSFKSVGSLFRATAGDISIRSGGGSVIQLEGRPSRSVNSLEAAGSVSIKGGSGDKLLVNLKDTGIQGGTGVEVLLFGTASELKAEYAEMSSPGGSVRISGGPKALLELKNVNLASGAGDTTVSVGADGAVLKAESTRISSQGGSVNLHAGMGSGWVSAVELVETTVDATQAVSVQASSGATNATRYGTVKVAKSTFSGGSDVVFRTGEFGTTEVKESSVSSGTAIRILTGANGKCSAEKNAYQAPLQQICS